MGDARLQESDGVGPIRETWQGTVLRGPHTPSLNIESWLTIFRLNADALIPDLPRFFPDANATHEFQATAIRFNQFMGDLIHPFFQRLKANIRSFCHKWI